MRRSGTRICVTEKSLRNPAKILGQIEMEESLGNNVVLYPKDHVKLLECIPHLTNEELTKAAPLLGRTYDTYARDFGEQQGMANVLSVNVNRIAPEALPPILSLLNRTHLVLDLRPEQEEFLLKTGEGDKVRNCHIQDYAFECVLRTKDLKNKAYIAERVWATTRDHYYVLQPVLRAYASMYTDPKDLFDNLRVLWDARVRAKKAVGADELSALLTLAQKTCQVRFLAGEIRLELKPKEEEKPNEETPA